MKNRSISMMFFLPALLALAWMVLACSTGGAPEEPGADEAAAEEGPGSVTQTVAKVNGQPLYRAFYDQNLNFLRKRLESEAPDVEGYLNSKFDAMEMLINDELLYQQAKREGVSAGESRIQEEYDRMVSTAGGELQLLADLLAQHISREMALEGLRKRLTVDKFVEEKIDPMLSVTHDEAVEYYNENQESLAPMLFLKVYQILIRCSPDAAEDVVQAARRHAEEIRSEILAGASFTEMARTYSEDQSAAVGGNLGFLKKGVLPPELDAAAFSISDGEISEPVRTEYGFHLVMVGERRGGETPEFEEVEADCRSRVMAGKRAAAIRGLVNRLKKEAEIETYL